MIHSLERDEWERQQADGYPLTVPARPVHVVVQAARARLRVLQMRHQAEKHARVHNDNLGGWLCQMADESAMRGLRGLWQAERDAQHRRAHFKELLSSDSADYLSPDVYAAILDAVEKSK